MWKPLKTVTRFNGTLPGGFLFWIGRSGLAVVIGVSSRINRRLDPLFKTLSKPLERRYKVVSAKRMTSNFSLGNFCLEITLTLTEQFRGHVPKIY